MTHKMIVHLGSFESGKLDQKDTVTLFQELIDSDSLRHLPGYYGHIAQRLIERGLVKERKECHTQTE